MSTSNTYAEYLHKHEPVKIRDEKAQETLAKIRSEFDGMETILVNHPVAIFCAGSLGRGDVGKLSDLDIYILSKMPKPRNVDCHIVDEYADQVSSCIGVMMESE